MGGLAQWQSDVLSLSCNLAVSSNWLGSEPLKLVIGVRTSVRSPIHGSGVLCCFSFLGVRSWVRLKNAHASWRGIKAIISDCLSEDTGSIPVVMANQIIIIVSSSNWLGGHPFKVEIGVRVSVRWPGSLSTQAWLIIPRKGIKGKTDKVPPEMVNQAKRAGTGLD